MRKTTREARRAWLNGENRKISKNTEVKDGAVYLFGNRIIWRDSGVVYFTFAGWNTTTTRDRINGILDLPLRGYQFYQYRGQLCVGDDRGISPGVVFQIIDDSVYQLRGEE